MAKFTTTCRSRSGAMRNLLILSTFASTLASALIDFDKAPHFNLADLIESDTVR